MNAIARAQELARLWADSSRSYPTPRSAQLLKSVVDAGGLDFTVGFVDGVIRPEDDGVAAANLARLAGEDTSFLPGYLRYLAKAGKLSNLAPGVASKAARTIFGALVGNLVLDVTDHKLGPALAELKKDGSRLNLNLLGEAVLGRREADRRLAAVERLIERPDVDYVSLKVSSVLGTHAAYGFDEGLDHAVDKLYPVYLNAKRHGTFINLDMEEYKDLHLTLEAFKELLSKPELEDYRAGIVLQAYLPDAREELARLTEWAKDRRARGGAPVKVRLVKGANLSMERVDATMHGWELAVWPTKAHSDAAYLRMLDDALTPENIDAVNIGVAGQNLFTLAYGVALAEERGLTIGDGIDIEMLAGMATPQAKAVADSVGPLLYYVPVVHPDEFDVAISYLVRRLEENTTPENFMSNVFDLPEDDSVFRLEQQRFLDAVDLRDTIDFSPRRTPWDGPTATGFTNARDTDPSLPENIARARDIAGRMTNSTLGSDLVDQAAVSTDAEIDALVHSARAAQAGWNSLGADRRAEILRAVAKGLHENRDRLLEVVGSETGKAIDQGDVEVSEAIDFAMYYAQAATELDHPGARFVPEEVTAVIPPWNFPIAIPTGGVLAALATGSAVVFKPAGLAARTGAVIAQIMWEAGVPRDVLQFMTISEAALDGDDNPGRHLVESVDQVILTGSSQTAELFRSWRPDLRLFAETSGKNSIIVTPQADIDLAVADVVASAFGHAGQKCSASSLVITVGSVGFSKRFHDQLLDAVSSLHVSYPDDLACQMPPLVEPAGEKLTRGLTRLGPGETWAIKPRQIDERLWTPGVRSGVQPGSDYHLTEFFGPILGVMRAETLEEALEWQNATDYGLTAGIHSLDSEEVSYWLDNVEAGNVYINRSITGAIVARQPFGGWKRSMVGTGSKAGGPNYLMGLGHYEPTGVHPEVEVTDPILARAAALSPTMVGYLAGINEDLEFLTSEGVDVTGLGVEKNVFRYLGAPNVVVRAGDGHERDAIAAVAAALALGARVDFSSSEPLPNDLQAFVDAYHVEHRVEDYSRFAPRMSSRARTPWGVRIRLFGEDARVLAEDVDGSIGAAIFAGPPTTSGRVEALPFLLEQAISATNHRFGNRTSILDGILP